MSEPEERFPFDIEFQKKILKLIISDPNFLIRAAKYLHKSYFDSDILGWIYQKSIDYYRETDKVITPTVLQTELRALKVDNLLEYVSIVNSVLKIEVTESEYIKTKLEEWLKRGVYSRAHKQAALLYNNSKFNESMECMKNSLDEISKISMDAPPFNFFIESVNERRTKKSKNENMEGQDRFTTGVLRLDTVVGGHGLSRGEFAVVVADAKVGKSIFLINVGASILIKDYGTKKVLHVNLEGKEDQIEDRYEARLLQCKYGDIVRNNYPTNYQNEYARIGNSLVIANLIYRWDYTVEDIENLLFELKAYNFIPDAIIVDYGDLLSPRKAAREDKYAGQEEVYRGLKTLATKHKAVVWTASQVHRVGKDVKPEIDPTFLFNRRNLADSYSKVRVADLLITLNRTTDEEKNNLMRIYVDAYRDAEKGFKIDVKTDYSRMISYIPTNEDILNYNKKIAEYE